MSFPKRSVDGSVQARRTSLEQQSVPFLETPKERKVSKYHDEEDPEIRKLRISRPVAVCMTLNFIMGCGFLGVPWAFNRVGIVFGSVFMVALTYLCLMTVSYILDGMKCAEALTRAKLDPIAHSSRPEYMVSGRKFELVELVEMFLGHRAKQIYIFIIILYLWGATWSYMVVFASSFSSHVPVAFIEGGRTCEVDSSCTAPYHFWSIVFAVVGTILTCLNLKEQEIMQITMTCLRFVLIILMVSTTLWAYLSGDDLFPGTELATDGGSLRQMFHPIGLPTFLPIALYSQLLHTGVPVLVQSVRNRQNSLYKVFGSAYAVTTTMYTFASIVIVLYFGNGTRASCNVNWSKFTGGYKSGEEPWWVLFISYMVVLFPALDVISVMPINGIIVASNIMASVYGEDTPKMERNRKLVTVYRVLGCLPAMVGGALIYQFDKVLDFTGVFGMLICMVFPGLIFEKSRATCQLRWPHYPHNPSDHWFSNVTVSRTIVALGVIGLIATTVQQLYLDV